MTSLSGRVAVVSGGGRGLGRSFCLALARQGASVVVNNRNRVVDEDGLGPADHVVAEIVSLGGSAVAEYSDAASSVAGDSMVEAALSRWGRLDICVANAGIGVGGMFHKQSASSFEEVLEINLLGSIRLARAAMAVMRPAGYGRIILVASTGGLHGDIGLSAYAASKGGLLAFGRSLAAEGAGKGVLTNMLLPYALTQMTSEGISSDDLRRRMTVEAVAPVLTALALAGLHAERGVHRDRRGVAAAGVGGGVGDGGAAGRAFAECGSAGVAGGGERAGEAEGVRGVGGRVYRSCWWPGVSWGPLLVNLGVTAVTVAVLMLATFGYAMRTRVHAIMDTVWALGFVIIALVSFLLSSGTGWLGGGCWCFCW